MKEHEERLSIKWLQDFEGLQQVSIIEDLYRNYRKDYVDQVIIESGSVYTLRLLREMSKLKSNEGIDGLWIQVLELEIGSIYKVLDDIRDVGLLEDLTKWVMLGYGYLTNYMREIVVEELPLEGVIIDYIQEKIDGEADMTAKEYGMLVKLLPEVEVDVYKELKVGSKKEIHGKADLWLSVVNNLQKQ